MTPEAELIALLQGHPSLVALNLSGVFLNYADEGQRLPYVVVTAQHDYEKTIKGDTDVEYVSYTLAAWGQSAAVAVQVADAVTAIIEAADNGIEVLARTGDFDPETQSDVELIAADEWRN